MLGCGSCTKAWTPEKGHRSGRSVSADASRRKRRREERAGGREPERRGHQVVTRRQKPSTADRTRRTQNQLQQEGEAADLHMPKAS